MAENRGGARVPDGVARPANLPFGRGPNRQDLSALPGTPGTPLPPNPNEPTVQYGQAGQFRRALADIPLEGVQPQTNNLFSKSQNPGEPVTAGIDRGMGPGSDALLPSPNQMAEQQAIQQSMHMYPLIARLASLPNATTQTKMMFRKMRSMAPHAPETMPQILPPPSENVVPRET